MLTSTRLRIACAGLMMAAALVAMLAAQTGREAAAAAQVTRFLETFNAGDRDGWQRFLSQFASPQPGPFVDQHVALRAQTGGFELVRMESASAGRAVAIVRER